MMGEDFKKDFAFGDFLLGSGFTVFLASSTWAFFLLLYALVYMVITDELITQHAFNFGFFFFGGLQMLSFALIGVTISHHSPALARHATSCYNVTDWARCPSEV